ncbi:MAG: ATP-binding cassette domain-containing protein [Armatimonadota bacterium]|nr:ATP-binding cassette domain-containing protein [Armatimonadota bacterium]
MPAERDTVLDVRVWIGTARDRDFTLDVAFQAPPGVTVLFGPSGSGKSTTLAAIAGLVRPDGGRIALGDQVWFDAERRVTRPVHTRGVSFVFQSLALFPHLTAARNVEFGIDRRVPRAERRRRALDMLERMRVAHLAQRRPPTFSGGEAQRVALARAFARSPSLVLLDEAFSAMDRDLRRELGSDVRAYVTEHRIPAILVTHHRMEARAMGDRAVLLDGGRVKAIGTLDQVLPVDEPAQHGGGFDDLDKTPMPLIHRG